jgi:uncharacterized protein
VPNYRLLPELSGASGDVIVGDAAARKASWVWMGTVAESGARRRLKLDLTAEHVVAMLGKRGTGKSYTLGVLLEGLGCAERETDLALASQPRATLVLDVLDIFWSSAIPLEPGADGELKKQFERMESARMRQVGVNIDVWIPAGFENPDIDLPQTQTLRLRLSPSDLTADDWAALFGFDLVAEPRGMLLDEVLRKVTITGWMDSGGNVHAALGQCGLGDLINCVDNDQDLSIAYTDQTRRSVRQRLAAQAANPVFQGQPTGLRQLLKEGRVTILMLGRLPDPYKRLLTTILVRQIFRERREASFARKRLDLGHHLTVGERGQLTSVVVRSIPRTWILVDEAQVLVPSDENTLSGEALIKFAKEGRNFGLSLAIATQQPSAVDGRLMSQVETLFVHQLTAKGDIDVALKSVKAPLPAESRVDGTVLEMTDLIRTLQQGDALFSCANGSGTVTRACIVRVRPRVTAHGGYEA